VKPLPFLVFVNTDPAVKVGAIVEMDCVSEYPEEPLIRTS
jgi:hypothetical protein